MGEYLRIEDLKVYQRLCELHIEICELTRKWPSQEQFELSSQDPTRVEQRTGELGGEA